MYYFPLLVLELLHVCPLHTLERENVKWPQWNAMSITHFTMISGLTPHVKAHIRSCKEDI